MRCPSPGNSYLEYSFYNWGTIRGNLVLGFEIPEIWVRIFENLHGRGGDINVSGTIYNPGSGSPAFYDSCPAPEGEWITNSQERLY